jgi:hypothetical protein
MGGFTIENRLAIRINVGNFYQTGIRTFLFKTAFSFEQENKTTAANAITIIALPVIIIIFFIF